MSVFFIKTIWLVKKIRRKFLKVFCPIIEGEEAKFEFLKSSKPASERFTCESNTDT